MSSEDEDYLSSKYLVEASDPKQPKSYGQLRKEAQKKSHIKHEQNRLKGRRQRELESREAGLSKSLFERAKEEEDAGLGPKNKALSIMMKMGFKPGQSLGRTGGGEKPESSNARESFSETSPTEADTENQPIEAPPREQNDSNFPSILSHIKEPLPLNEWSGKKGIGLGKRERSPDASERLAKMAKMAEEADHRDFRERARDEYKNRQAEGRLGPAQLTCASLDERTEKKFNVLWLNPNNENTFPAGLMNALSLHSNLAFGNYQGSASSATTAERLRLKMQADALQPIGGGDYEEPSSDSVKSCLEEFSPETLEEATQFLRLQAQDRLHLVLSYLRDRHHYCFWCGIKYESSEEMENQCPGPHEDDHD